MPLPPGPRRESQPAVPPEFTVIIATYGRGSLIDSTLRSVALQEHQNFEVLVVSDGPPAEGLAESVERFGSRFRLIQTPHRSRSQSEPNNRGWNDANGRFIAYLGHDDLWHPAHLTRLREAFSHHPDAHFAVSGCLYFGAPGTGDEQTWVTGMFDSDDQSIPATHFFPPSGLSHHRDLPATVTRWSPPETSRHPVDTLFLLGAVAAGMRFASTNAVTVFKFASALRYLSYLCPDDVEQREMLGRIAEPDSLEDFIAERVDAAIQHGGFMASTYAQHPTREPGEQLAINEQVRGTEPIALTELSEPLWIPPGREPRGSDWYGPETEHGRAYRWSGPNPQPRLTLPFFTPSEVRVRVHVTHFASADVRTSLRVSLNSTPVDISVTPSPTEEGWIVSFFGKLRPDVPSVIEFHTKATVLGTDFAPGSGDLRRLGFAYQGIDLRPLD